MIADRGKRIREEAEFSRQQAEEYKARGGLDENDKPL